MFPKLKYKEKLITKNWNVSTLSLFFFGLVLVYIATKKNEV